MKETSVMTLPRLEVHVPARARGAAALPAAAGETVAAVRWENVRPEPCRARVGGTTVFVLGRPFRGDVTDREELGRRVLDARDSASALAEFDGSFLFIVDDAGAGTLTVVNDRFGSVPFYYYRSATDGFFGATGYTDVWRRQREGGELVVAEDAFFEFFHFQRLLGQKTYDRASLCLDPASALTYSYRDGSLTVRKYWAPDFSKDRRASLRDFGGLLAENIKSAVGTRISFGGRVGLLLSGGLDSRTVLAAAEGPVPCLTVGDRRNNEFRVAAVIAAARGAPHTFVARSADHYANILEPAVRLGGCMGSCIHAHFLNFGDQVRPIADVLLHGHGFDYLFQGMYLPTEYVSVAGRRTRYQRLLPIAEDFSRQYVNEAKYRLKDLDSFAVVKPAHSDRLSEALRHSVEEVAGPVRDRCDEPYDLWDYLHWHNLSRHYTSLNLASIRCFAEERTAAFDNAILDLYLRMPAKMRLGGAVLREALRRLDPAIGRIPGSTFNIPVTYGPLAATLFELRGSLLRRIGLGRPAPTTSPASERSWPDLASITRCVPGVRARVEALPRSEALASLRWLDMDRLAERVDSHLAERSNHASALLALVTIDEFLRIGLAPVRPDVESPREASV